MFHNSKFNGDISQWNVINVLNMNGMFFISQLNSDISNWNVYNVENITDMFEYCQAPIPYWYIEDKELRQQVVKNYQEKKDLHQKLNNNLNRDKIIIKQKKI